MTRESICESAFKRGDKKKVPNANKERQFCEFNGPECVDNLNAWQKSNVIFIYALPSRRFLSPFAFLQSLVGLNWIEVYSKNRQFLVCNKFGFPVEFPINITLHKSLQQRKCLATCLTKTGIKANRKTFAKNLNVVYKSSPKDWHCQLWTEKSQLNGTSCQGLD